MRSKRFLWGIMAWISFCIASMLTSLARTLALRPWFSSLRPWMSFCIASILTSTSAIRSEVAVTGEDPCGDTSFRSFVPPA
jgi:hypothetical protein